MRALTTILFLVFGLNAMAQSFAPQIDVFLEKHVKNGLVDYKTIKASPAELNQLLNQFNRTPLLKGDAEKALLINAYNIFVIKAVVDNYPAESPLKIDGFFDKKTFNLRGKKVTLNQVEKEMLYKQFPDARLHFALVCAAVGCPKLASHAYVSDNLDAQLQDQTRAVINDPTFIHSAGATVQVSKIFEWYAADFGGKEKVIPFIQKYLLKKIRLNPKYSFYEYDWTLNELK